MTPEEQYGMDFEDLDEDEQEVVEEEETPKPKKSLKPKARRKEAIQKLKKQSSRPSVRFSAFQMPSRIGIIDNETKEVVAEGDAGIYQCFANIIERLERIEYKIGDILEE